MPDDIGKLTELASGPAAAIRALPDVAKSINGLDEKRKQRLNHIMRTAVDLGPERLPPEQFKREERLSIGDRAGNKVQVYAFKVWQFRVYACDRHHAGKRTFICTEVDESKKKDRADRAKLKRAATKFAPFYS